ncbi:hypothetical protein [Cupriavidus pampae]|uniref:Uncharacterized protein n=1 Tax=Cupriavidus pampae TaxID=659251 RepID=A0ABM8XZR6_9BURK|nr:hypothetical protein [Cupriavidus pampae]CAG9185888.1 hypothetical protein LMG32289_06145 [Cupriavidus pampae]
MTFTNLASTATAPRMLNVLAKTSAEFISQGARGDDMVDYASVYERVVEGHVRVSVHGRQEDFESLRSNPHMTNAEKGLEVVRNLAEKLIPTFVEESNAGGIAMTIVKAIISPDIMQADLVAAQKASLSHSLGSSAGQSVNVTFDGKGKISIHKSSEWRTCYGKVADRRGIHTPIHGDPILRTDIVFEISTTAEQTRYGPMLGLKLKHWHHSGDDASPVVHELSSASQTRSLPQLIKDLLSDFCARAGIRFEICNVTGDQTTALAKSRGDDAWPNAAANYFSQQHFNSAWTTTLYSRRIAPQQHLAPKITPAAWRVAALTREIDLTQRAIAGLKTDRASLLGTHDNMARHINEIRRRIVDHPNNKELATTIGRAERIQRKAIDAAYAELRGKGDADLRDALQKMNERIRELESVVRDGIADDEDEVLLKGLRDGRQALQQAADGQRARILDQLRTAIADGPPMDLPRRAYRDALTAQARAREQLELLERNDRHLQDAMEARENVSDKLSECNRRLDALNDDLEGLRNAKVKNMLLAEGKRDEADHFIMSIRAPLDASLIGRIRGPLPIANLALTMVRSRLASLSILPNDNATTLREEIDVELRDVGSQLAKSGIPLDSLVVTYRELNNVLHSPAGSLFMKIHEEISNAHQAIASAIHTLDPDFRGDDSVEVGHALSQSQFSRMLLTSMDHPDYRALSPYNPTIDNLPPAKICHYRVDVDKNLLYRGKLPPHASAADFFQSRLTHHSYGDVTVFINIQMIEFLKQQKNYGAKVSILSTGGWNELSIRSRMKDFGVTIDEFDNKKTLNTQSTITVGLFQKFRVMGNQDSEGRTNIMMDDQWHQRALFKNSIDARRFGMG